jgi:hypothetical protein
VLRGPVGGFLPRLRQLGVQRLGCQALQRAEVGLGQRAVLERAQQLQPIAPRLLFGALLFLLRLPLRTTGLFGLLLAFLAQRTAARELLRGGFVVLGADLAGGLAVQVEALRGLAHGHQVGPAAGVAAEEDGQQLAREHPRRALLDVGLDAQLQRLGGAAEQRREARLQLGRALVQRHRRRIGRRSGVGCAVGSGRGGCSGRRCLGFRCRGRRRLGFRRHGGGGFGRRLGLRQGFGGFAVHGRGSRSRARLSTGGAFRARPIARSGPWPARNGSIGRCRRRGHALP